jgi:hypothetical protein
MKPEREVITLLVVALVIGGLVVWFFRSAFYAHLQVYFAP